MLGVLGLLGVLLLRVLGLLRVRFLRLGVLRVDRLLRLLGVLLLRVLGLLVALLRVLLGSLLSVLLLSLLRVDLLLLGWLAELLPNDLNQPAWQTDSIEFIVIDIHQCLFRVVPVGLEVTDVLIEVGMRPFQFIGDRVKKFANIAHFCFKIFLNYSLFYATINPIWSAW